MAVIPKVTEVKIIPVAGYDSPTLTLSGCHYPFFTRNIVIIKDDSGNQGIGEIHGGEPIKKSLESYIPFVIGHDISDYRNIIKNIQEKIGHPDDKGEGIQKLDISQLQYVVHAEAAIECALLDLMGKFLHKPMVDIIGQGRHRDSVPFLGYLFYVADRDKIDLPYIKDDQNQGADEWSKIRRSEIMDADGIVNEARVLHEKYGFTSFKLKGGVFDGKTEMETVKKLHETFPNYRINIDPNGCWSLEEAIDLMKKYGANLTYVEDPTNAEAGFSGREVLSYFRNATNMSVATNMIAVNWKQLYPALQMKAIDIVLADPHFWGIEGTLRVAAILNDWGLTWGSHSNNHFDITLALYAQVAAAAPKITPIDTHFIWQDGQQLCDNALQIKKGQICIPNRPGLGVTINENKLAKAHELYEKLSFKGRDDTKAMQYLIKDWQFDPDHPVFVR